MAKTKYTDAVRSRAYALLSEGRTLASIRETLFAEGVRPPPSEGWLVGLRRGPAPSPPAAALPASPAIPATSAILAPAPTGPVRPALEIPADAPLDVRIRLALEHQALELLDTLQRVGTAGDLRALGGVSRALTATMGELRRALPDSPADPDDVVGIPGPQIREAAERGRAKMRELVARVRAERALWPRCERCGQPIEPPAWEPGPPAVPAAKDPSR